MVEPFRAAAADAGEPPEREDARSGRELDQLTLARAQRGEEAACRALVLLHERAVFRMIAQVLGRHGRQGLTPDLAQETFLRVFRELPAFVPAGPARLSTWILTIAARVALDELKRRRLDTTPIGDELGTLPAPARTEGATDTREALAAIERALAALPADQRAVLILRVDEDREYADIATALGIEIGTVKSRLARARAALWAALSGLRGGA